jgi:hypothetical protein
VPSDWPIALALVVGLMALLALAIFLGLRIRRRQIHQNLANVSAETVWQELFLDAPGAANAGLNRKDLLYGVWQDFAMTSVGMIVMSGQDVPVARITSTNFGSTIAIGESTYRIVPQMTWQASANLCTVDGENVNDRSPVCSFSRRGRMGSAVVRYTAASGEVLEIPSSWRSPFRRYANTIKYDGNPAGAVFTIGQPYLNKGRAVVLPDRLPLPIRVFVLAWGTGPSRAVAK